MASLEAVKTQFLLRRSFCLSAALNFPRSSWDWHVCWSSTIPAFRQIGLELAPFYSKESSTRLCTVSWGSLLSHHSLLTPRWANKNQDCESLVSEATGKHKTKESPDESKGTDQANHDSDQHENYTLFDLLLPPKSDRHIETIPMDEFVDEAFGLLAAGTDTTAYTLACGTYYLLTSPEALSRLRKELDDNTHLIRDASQWHRMQNLPYLVCWLQRLILIEPSGLHRDLSGSRYSGDIASV